MTIEQIKKEIKKARQKGQWIACMLWEKRLEKAEQDTKSINKIIK